MSRSDVLGTFREVIKGPRNAYLDEWKAGGGRVMGCYCSYVPEEILSAAGFLPYRLRGAGAEDSSAGDAYMSARVCTFVRHTMTLALRGELDFLDGVVLLQNCDHIRRAADLFNKKTLTPFYCFLSVPRAPKERLFGWYLEELERLTGELEAHFGIAITDQRLDEAIDLHNATRERIGRLYDLRKRDAPPVTGEEALTATIAAHLMPRQEFNRLMDGLLAHLEHSDGSTTHRARVIITGGELDSPDYIANIEGQGALSVAELVCFGQRSFGDPIPAGDGGPLERIARHRFFQAPCARMAECLDDEVRNLKNALVDYSADGIILQRIKFCDPWAGDAHNLYWAMIKEGIPFLPLEREYQVPAAGQVKTRIQAFLEQLGK